MLTLEVASRASSARRFVVAAVAGALCAACASKSDGSLRQLNRRSGGEDEVRAAAADGQRYEHAETRELVALVDDAATLIETDGEAAFDELRVPGSRWRQGETYIFVLDPTGGMRVHPDAALEGKNQLGLKDVNGRPICGGSSRVTRPT